MFYDIFDSPIGALTVCADQTAVIGLYIDGDARLPRVPLDWIRDEDNSLLRQVKHELAEYFAGARPVFSIPVRLVGTPFQQGVWRAVQDIPAGQTATYGQLAVTLGQPHAAVAVEEALRQNPVSILVPCHRVLAGNGALGHYLAGLGRKQMLLELEERYATFAAPGREILQSE
jgi:methylated-DNA-[protein]-cysteine S-methyltransferase